MSADRRDAPEVVVRNALRNGLTETTGWDATNTSSVTPGIHHGWVNVDHGHPEVTVSNPEQSPIDGGETGFSGMDPTGGGPTQTFDGTVQVNVWTDRERSDVNPQQLAWQMRVEIRRIITAEFEAGDTGLTRLVDLGGERSIDDDYDPPMVRYRIEIGYGRYTHPSTSPA